MSKRSKHYMLLGKVSYMISAALMIAALVTNMIPPRIASAHHSIISGTVACQSDGTKLVTWTITNWQLTGDPFEITAISPSINGVGVGTVVGASVQGTQSFAGNDHSTVSLSVSGKWTDATSTNSGSVDLGSNTCPGETPPASASVTVGACTYHDGNSSTKVTLTLSHATLTITGGSTFSSSTDIDLAPGHYHYTWTHKSGYTGSGSGDFDIGSCAPAASASVTVGACTFHDGNSSTKVTLTLSHAKLTINGSTYSSSQDIFLHPGHYDYTWTAKSGYSGSGSGDLDIGSCAPSATASISLGSCTYHDGVSTINMTITLNHADLNINGNHYNNSTTTHLHPGSYPWTADADDGYVFSGDSSGTLEVAGCPPPPPVTICWNGQTYTNVAVADLVNYPGYTNGACPPPPPVTICWQGTTYSNVAVADLGLYPGYTEGACPEPPDGSASVTPGSCSWAAGVGSLTPVSYEMDGASLTITNSGTSASYGPFTTSGSVNLGLGSYSYSWTALSGHKGSGSGAFSVSDCTPPDGSASVTPGTCSWAAGVGSLTPVSYDLDGASLTITDNGTSASYGPYTTSGSVNLGLGSYSYSWTALSGHKGSGSGAFSVSDCTPPDASASVTPGDCSWTSETGSLTPVTITINGASLLIDGKTYTSTTTIDLGQGTYPYTWTALSGYLGEGSGSVVIGNCTPGNAEASVSTGACSYSKETGASTPVTITLTGASFTVAGNTYIASTLIDLGPGIYPYTWTHLTGYIGEGSGDLNVGNCNPEDPLVKTANPLTYSAVGEVISYTYGVTNLGNVPLTGVLVTDDKAVVSCPKTTLAVNETMTCTASYTITQADLDAGSVTNHATSVTDQTGPVYAQATVTAVVRTGLSIDKSVAEKIYTLVGDQLHYSYLVTNTGNVSLTGVGVTDDKTTTVCPKDKLAPTESMTCTATYSVKNADMQSVNIVNTAYAYGQYGTVVVNSAPDSATVIRFLKLILSSKCAANPGANNGWLVANNNPYEVDFEYAIDGGVSGVGTVPGNSTVSFETPVGSGTGVMSLYKSGELQNNATPRTGCNDNPPPPVPGCMDATALNYNAAATQSDGSCLYGEVTGGGPAVLIPVTGMDMGLLGRTLPGTLFGLSFSFVGLGLVLTGLARRRED